MGGILDEHYYLEVDGQLRGPYTIPQLKHMVTSGIVQRTARYWMEGMEENRPVEELFTPPRRRWGRTVFRVALWLTLLLAAVLCFLFTAAGEPESWWESSGVGEFVRKTIYILFFKGRGE